MHMNMRQLYELRPLHFDGACQGETDPEPSPLWSQQIRQCSVLDCKHEHASLYLGWRYGAKLWVLCQICVNHETKSEYAVLLLGVTDLAQDDSMLQPLTPPQHHLQLPHSPACTQLPPGTAHTHPILSRSDCNTTCWPAMSHGGIQPTDATADTCCIKSRCGCVYLLPHHPAVSFCRSHPAMLPCCHGNGAYMTGS